MARMKQIQDYNKFIQEATAEFMKATVQPYEHEIGNKNGSAQAKRKIELIQGVLHAL